MFRMYFELWGSLLKAPVRFVMTQIKCGIHLIYCNKVWDMVCNILCV